MERDEQTYAYVMDELENGIKNEALWIKAYAMSEGQEERIKPRYMQYRVEEFKECFKKYNIEYEDLLQNEIGKFIESNFVYSIRDLTIDRLTEWSKYTKANLRIKTKYTKDNLLKLTTGGEFDKDNILEINILDRTGLEINYIPKEIGFIKSLTELHFAANCFDHRYPGGTVYNHIKYLPESIGELSNLTVIDLSDNSLFSLPSTIGNLNNLKELNLLGNALIKLPKEIVNLTQLKKLNLSFNPDLILSEKQKDWISYLEESGCDVQNEQMEYLIYNTPYCNLTDGAKILLKE